LDKFNSLYILQLVGIIIAETAEKVQYYLFLAYYAAKPAH